MIWIVLLLISVQLLLIYVRTEPLSHRHLDNLNHSWVEVLCVVEDIAPESVLQERVESLVEAARHKLNVATVHCHHQGGHSGISHRVHIYFIVVNQDSKRVQFASLAGKVHGSSPKFILGVQICTSCHDLTQAVSVARHRHMHGYSGTENKERGIHWKACVNDLQNWLDVAFFDSLDHDYFGSFKSLLLSLCLLHF